MSNDNFKKAQKIYDSMTPPDETKISCYRCGKNCYISDLDAIIINTSCADYHIPYMCQDCVDEIVEFARRSK